MRIILSGVVEGLRTRQDGSVVFSLASQELDPSQAANLFQLRNTFVKCLLSDSNISPLEEKLVDEEKINGGKKSKSPQQRLRNVMYRVHEQEGISQPFEDWYKTEIERLIEQYKEVLQ